MVQPMTSTAPRAVSGPKGRGPVPYSANTAMTAERTAQTTPSGRPIRRASSIRTRPAKRRTAPGRAVWSSRPDR